VISSLLVDPGAQEADFKAHHRLVSVHGLSGAAIAYDYKPCASIAVREVAVGGRRDVRCIARRENTLYVGVHGGGVATLDITDPRDAKPLGMFAMPGSELVDFALAGDTLYAADFHAGIHAIDVSDPAQPRHVGMHYALSHANNRRVVVADKTLVLVNDHALSIFDISTPTQFRPIALHHRMRTAVGWLRGVVFEGTHLHVTQGPMGLWTFDMTDPAKPHPIAGQEPRLDSRPNERLICDSIARFESRIFVGTSSGIWSLKLGAIPESESFFTGPGTIRDAAGAVRDNQLFFCALEPHDHVFHIFDTAQGVRYMGRQRLSRMIDRIYDLEVGNGFWIAAAGPSGVLFAGY